MRIKQSVCLPIYQAGYSLDELCRELAGIGYQAVELWGWDESVDEVAATAKRHGLVLCSFSGHESIDHGFDDPSQHERCQTELMRSVDKAVELGVPGVICFPGARRPGISDVEGLVLTAKGIRPVARYAESKGVNLNMEVLNSRVDHPGYIGDTVDWCVALCEMVGSPRMKILFDVYHVQIMQGDIIRNLRKAMPFIGHVHTAGNPGRQELDDTQELNYRGIMKALADAGYEGYVGHEFFPRSADKLATLQQAFAACDV